MSEYPGNETNNSSTQMAKEIAVWIIRFILFTLAVSLGFIIVDTWKRSSTITHIFREASSDFQILFIGMMVFAGLYFVSILTRFIIWEITSVIIQKKG